MNILEGKGIWTLYDDINLAVEKAPQYGSKYILCKVSKRGAYWEERAQQALEKVNQNPDLVPVAWMFNYLEDIEAEAKCIESALKDGFEAMILDAEAEIEMKFEEADELAQKVSDLGLDTERIYLCSDPRLDRKIDEIPTIQLAKICRGGFIPMIYGEILPSDRASAAMTISENARSEYETHKDSFNYEIPLMPAIAPYWDNMGSEKMDYAEFKKWCDQALIGNPGFVSLYRAGVTSEGAWRAFGELQVAGNEEGVQPEIDPESEPEDDNDHNEIFQPLEFDYPGVTYQAVRWKGANCHIVEIDCVRKGVSFLVTKCTSHNERRTVSATAKILGAQIVVNGDGWKGNRIPNSIAASSILPLGKRVYKDVQFGWRPWVNISENNNVVTFFDEKYKKKYRKFLDNAVSGERLVLFKGEKKLNTGDIGKKPRTAVGYSSNKKKLILIVADGRTDESAGLSIDELHDLFKDIDIDTDYAMNLDGGGSSAMWIKDRIVNVPIHDNVSGQERAVANHLCIFISE